MRIEAFIAATRRHARATAAVACFAALSVEAAGTREGLAAETAEARTSGTIRAGYGDLVEDDGRGARMPTLFRRIDKSAFPRDWPFSLDLVDVGCALSRPQTTVLVIVAGQPWALNDATRTWVRQKAPRLEIAGSLAQVIAADAHEPWIAASSEADDAPRSLAPVMEVARRMGCMARPRT